MKILIKNAVKRNVGCLYYLDGKGNLCMCKFDGPNNLSNKEYLLAVRRARYYFNRNAEKILK